jgi:hypothetical protein
VFPPQAPYSLEPPSRGLEVSYEHRLIAFVALGSVALGTAVAAAVKARRARQEGTRYVLASWDAGFLFAGRAVDPRWGVAIAAAHFLLSTVVLGGVAFGFWPAKNLAFSIPDGWLDVSSDAPSENKARLPEELRAWAAQIAAQMVRLAIDVEHEHDGQYPHFSAGQTTLDGELSDQSFDEFLQRMLKREAEANASITAHTLTIQNGRPFGRAVVDVTASERATRTFVYIFPRDGRHAVIGCVVPLHMVGRYEAICDATAAANARPQPARH